jgi:arachidonate 15-lipoxygenase
VLVALGLFLARVCPLMRRGLPSIDADVDRALDDARIATYARAFRAPVRPAAYDGDGPPDLGELAVQSPYAVFTARDADGELHWDFRRLREFPHHDELCSLGLRVVFSPSSETRRLVAARIESDELGVVSAGDAGWERAATLAVCAATTHLALARHFNFVHLISGNHWDVATRNRLPTDHPLYRLLWPHVFNSLYTNYGVTRVQMLPDGDYVNMFSFTHDGLMAYFDAMYEAYDITVTDPHADWTRRGLGEEEFDCPTQANLVELFDVMHGHASRYLDAYYESDAALRADPATRAWLDELDELVPNGVGDALDGEVTKAGLARLIGGYIYEGNTIHDLAGTTLWDYQLWADRNPVRVYRDGRRMPVDVFQRAINNNFALQLRRAPLLADYGEVALDDRGAALFTELFEDCRSLQARYDRTAAGPWRMEPKNLEINMNG